MKLLYCLVAWVYKSLAAAVGIEPVEYLVNQALEDGASQEKLNLMLDRLGFV